MTPEHSLYTSYFWQERVGLFDEVMTRVAFDNGLAKVDIFKPMLEQDWRQMLFADGLHPNALGHAFVADKVRPVLWEMLNR